MPSDSILNAIAAAVLFAAAVFAWRRGARLKPPARLPLRFAAVLLAALAIASVVRLGEAAALLLLPLAAAALALSSLARFARPPASFTASCVLVLALAGGVAAAISGRPMLALLPAALASLVIIAASLNGLAWRGAAAGLALLLGVLVCLQGGGAAVLLLAAAALTGLTPAGQALEFQPSRRSAGRGAASR